MKTPTNAPATFHDINSQVVIDRPRSTDIHGKTGTVLRRLGDAYDVQVGEDTYTLDGDTLRPVE